MSAVPPRVLCLSGYDAASHRRWRETLASHLAGFEWHHCALPPRYFRWRIRGNPLSWLEEPLLQQDWDLLLVTSMVDLAVLRGLHPKLALTPAVAYFHENQFSYPQQANSTPNAEPRVVNLYTALSADRVLFNSAWNRESFLEGVRVLRKQVPDQKPAGLVEQLSGKSEVLPVPIEDRLFGAQPRDWSEWPHLVWNHRWEYDKGPDRLLALLRCLAEAGQPFRLSVVGEQFRSAPEAFECIAREFEHSIVYWGHIASRDDYEALLTEVDMVLSTALHDFQGLAVLEAMACGAVPVVPDRLAYPEYVPEACRYTSLTDEPEREGRLAAKCIMSLLSQERPDPARFRPDGYRLEQLLPHYETALLETCRAGRGG